MRRRSLIGSVMVLFTLLLLLIPAVAAEEPAAPTPTLAVTPIEYVPTTQPDAVATEAPLADSDLSTMRNPAAIYCAELGYSVVTETGDDGEQQSYCLFADGSTCPLWDFFSGFCGQDYDACAQQGLSTITESGGASFAPEYAVCVDEAGAAVDTAANLIALNDKVGLPAEGQSSEETVNDEEYGAIPFDTSTVDADALPSSFDWRNNGGNWLSSVKDQGICGSCWAFAAVGASEAALNIANNNASLDPNLSEQYLVSDCYTGGDCTGGLAANGLAYIRDSGVPDESCLPYVDGGSSGCTTDSSGNCATSCTYRSSSACSDTTCSNRCSDWASRLSKVSSVISLGQYPSRDTIKQALIDYGPLTVRMYPYGTWSSSSSTGVLTCSDNSTMGHAVVLVGYNDSGSYWILKNSWGSSWRDSGYFRVAYGSCAVERYPYAVVATSTTIPQNVAASDGTYADRIAITWSAVSGATSYTVYYADAADGTPTALGSTTSTSYSDYTATSETTRYYGVQACINSSCGGLSALDSGYRKLVADAYESDNTSGQARTLAPGTTERHSLVPVGDMDWYRFTLSGTAGVVIETSGYNDDTVLRLYNSAVTLLEEDDDSGEGTFSRIDRLVGVDPLPAGTYYLSVEDYGNDDRIAMYDILLLITPNAPTGVTASEGSPTLTVSWNAVTGADAYRVYAATSAAGDKLLVGETTETSLIHGAAVPLTTYYYWVRAGNELDWGDYSASDTGQRTAVSVTREVALPVMLQQSSTGFPEGFDSQFNGNRNSWVVEASTWAAGASYLTGAGLADGTASISYYLPFSNLDYSVRLKRLGSDTSANRLMIRGQPDPLSGKSAWQRSYLFQYTSGGSYSVWLVNDAESTALQGWTSSAAISTGANWNRLRVVAQGEDLLFYINGTLVWAGTDATLTGGKVGIGFYSPEDVTSDTLQVDWATLDAPDGAAAAADAQTFVPSPSAKDAEAGGNINEAPGAE